MTTATIKPIIHVYKEIGNRKYQGVKHYQLTDLKNGKTKLTNHINISKDRGFAISRPTYWLKVKSGHKWSKCITGLFKTELPNIYIGDSNFKKNLLIFKFNEDASTLTIFYFPNYYTSQLGELLNFINL